MKSNPPADVQPHSASERDSPQMIAALCVLSLFLCTKTQENFDRQNKFRNFAPTKDKADMSIKPRYISEDECREFQQQHPDLKRKEIFAQHWQYYQAMRRYDLLDTLYPLRKHAVKHTDEELIQAARKYQHVTDMAKSEKAALNAIYRRHLEDRAFRHMKPQGDRKHKFIYAYEFPDHAVYVGLTYDHNIRHAGHFDKRSNSAVRRHKEQTGQEPTYKQLTDLMPVEQAQQMEGHWEEQYRQQGWTILNVAKTGGLGGIPLKAIDPQKIVCLFQRGTPPAAIARQLGISTRTTYKILKQAGLSYRGMSAVTVEMTDEQGNIVLTFPSVQAAADHYGMHPANIRTSIKKGWRVRGLHIRYNQFEYEIKHRCRQAIPTVEVLEE